MVITYFRTGLILFMFCWVSMAFGLEAEERKIIKAIKDGDFEFMHSVIKNRPDVNCVFSNGKSGLFYAIKYDRDKIARLILSKGAKPDHVSNKYSLLTWAIKYDRRRIARLLIEYGANVNGVDAKLNTPLILAAKLNNIWMCKMLIDRGANPTHENIKKQKASDFTIYWEKQNTGKYLLGMEEKWLEAKSVQPMQDGPYIFKETDEELVMQYYEHLQSDNLTRLIERTIEYKGNDTIIAGIRWDRNTYHIKEKYKPVPYKISTDAQIFAVGDVHGKYNALRKLLAGNKIVDESGNWIFGKGLLVFLGDIFDRGSMVTETLWYLHELSFEAEKSGGRLLLLLGNHEIMALTGDHRYVNDKYDFFNHYTFTNYFELFAKNSILGDWLRNQGAILQINDNLFMHAGISPQFAENNYSITEINLAIQSYLNLESDPHKNSIEEHSLGSYGPLWYRGYMESNETKVLQTFVDDYLKTKEMSRMILGHNEQENIITSYQGKIVSIDIQINEDGSSAQGLLITDNKLYRCYSDGRKELLK